MAILPGAPRPDRPAQAAAQADALRRIRRTGSWTTLFFAGFFCLVLTFIGSTFTVVGRGIPGDQAVVFTVIGPLMLLGAVAAIVIAVTVNRRRARLLRDLPDFDVTRVPAPSGRPWGLAQVAAALEAWLVDTPYLVALEGSVIRIQMAMHVRDVPLPTGAGTGTLGVVVTTELTTTADGGLRRVDRGYSRASSQVARGRWVTRTSGIFPGLPEGHRLGGMRVHPSDLDEVIARVARESGRPLQQA